MRNRILMLICVAVLLVMAGISMPLRSVSAGSPAQETEEPAKCDQAFIDQLNTDFAAIEKAGSAISQPKMTDVMAMAELIIGTRVKYEDLPPVAGCEIVQLYTVSFLSSTEDLILVIAAVTGDAANQAAYVTAAKPLQERNDALKAKLQALGVTIGKPAAAATEAK